MPAMTATAECEAGEIRLRPRARTAARQRDERPQHDVRQPVCATLPTSCSTSRRSARHRSVMLAERSRAPPTPSAIDHRRPAATRPGASARCRGETRARQRDAGEVDLAVTSSTQTATQSAAANSRQRMRRRDSDHHRAEQHARSAIAGSGGSAVAAATPAPEIETASRRRRTRAARCPSGTARRPAATAISTRPPAPAPTRACRSKFAGARLLRPARRDSLRGRAGAQETEIEIGHADDRAAQIPRLSQPPQPRPGSRLRTRADDDVAGRRSLRN